VGVQKGIAAEGETKSSPEKWGNFITATEKNLSKNLSVGGVLMEKNSRGGEKAQKNEKNDEKKKAGFRSFYLGQHERGLGARGSWIGKLAARFIGK